MSHDVQALACLFFADAAFNIIFIYVLSMIDGNGRSQLGYLVLLADKTNRANIIHYASRRCRRVTRSVFAAELFALSEATDSAIAFFEQVSEILGPKLAPTVWGVLDSRTVFDAIVRLGHVTEKHLNVDVAVLREAHLEGKLSRLFWSPGVANAADGFTKIIENAVFTQIFEANRLELSSEAWTEPVPQGNPVLTKERQNGHEGDQETINGESSECQKYCKG